jgi:hypothetical protein
VKTNFAQDARPNSQRLAELEAKTARLEELYDGREPRDREPDRSARAWETALDLGPEAGFAAGGRGRRRGDGAPYGEMPPSMDGYGPRRRRSSAAERTAMLVSHGRFSARNRRAPLAVKVAAAAAIIAVAIAVLVRLAASGAGPSWPASVARVQAEITKACQNSDVSSEPGQVNFACAKPTRHMLWAFSLLTSQNNPDFAEAKTGRVGLEPITPAQGGVVAWSLNLHHPYDPTNPVDSLEVAARAINNIIGGATATSRSGKPVIQSGLESHAANCLRYTGSPAVKSRNGFPAVCAQPVVSPAGQAALVADVYQRWVVGASPVAAQQAATLFENWNNPGSPQVQAILRHLPKAGR